MIGGIKMNYDYIQIGLMTLAVILLVIVVVKLFTKEHDARLIEQQKDLQSELKLHLQKEYGNLKLEMNQLFNDANKTNQMDLNTFKDSMMVTIHRQLKEIN